MKRNITRWNSRFEALEDRAMLSLATAPLPRPLATPAPATVTAVESAYSTFVSKYLSLENSILLSSSTPSSNRTAFNGDVTILLTNLNTSIDSAISALPSEATLEPAITAQLLSASPNALATELAAIASPPTTGSSDVSLFNDEALTAVGESAYTIVKEVSLATPPSPTPTGNALITYEVSTALSTFEAEYKASIGSILYAPNGSGNINLTTNRALFNAAISTDLTQLQNGLLASVSTLDSSILTTLDPAIMSAVSALKTQLLAVPTPSGAYTSSAILFTIDSDTILSQTSTAITTLITDALPTS
jgi:hypothetical protein